ncbi:3-hydroxylacyl-ACP dehydratase [Myxococcus sp. MISCRS1]|jgi:predicted hotdog family 3-hydroxylacyl-ACP dehydratase|uniref:ApeP family dehydratase n=1 Tax=Myxococcus TaxID=32 RepID=UPI001144526F|nr:MULTISPECIES: 3-hydroxylacyl-ACP dehydratase [Myxococcus]BDT33809.1 3-hydroxylacyl-ACP dehydratase [Myxococcus sp. MH1]MBZ4400154.1 3-hydroxylacyl-ACP dehydratase [Myxococcus sp. AS-1-15]MBZ4412447.1 3-hydroxylacyl-ACP dehydratase [Myxococcus sp. XM-1-1-1]MCK8496605.1 3-hydroxylacyl-ACP dehydratase [Myxococcus fulvus]MCP3062263.1 3-hydroxylacyl-ACP dehydratase [Myxococcus guangdongensis]
MRTPIAFDISEIVPHADRMRLIDRAVEGDEEGLVAEVTLREDCLFQEGGEVGGWVGIEFMAQAIAAYAGWRQRLQGQPQRMGFLLGTRKYECSRPSFKVGEHLRIEVRRQFWTDEGMSQFDCTLGVGGETVATAALTVFQPPASVDLTKVGKDE